MDGLSVIEMIENLRGIKLSKAARQRVLDLHEKLRAVGAVSFREEQDLRRMHKTHQSAITRLQEARERGRMSLARERLGVTASELERSRLEALEDRKRRAEDLGF